MSAVALVLCSGSPARLATLRDAGLSPEVIVSGVDEAGVDGETPAELATRLATSKARAVHNGLDHDHEGVRVLVGCDSVLELDGVAYGKPHEPEVARERWHRMRGRTGVLHTGHHVVVCGDEGCTERADVASTIVHFADVSDAEIDAYVATGEPLAVAGAFTIDGLGGAFVDGIEGDPHNVVGIGLPLLRRMLAELGVAWPSLWAHDH